MAKLRLLVELEYDAEIMHGNDPSEIEWFRDIILKGPLALISNNLGEEVGEITVLEIL